MEGPRERRLYLVRHGETEGQSSVRFHGRNDVTLSPVGREQVRRLAPLFAHVRFQAVLHSPLSRARESAEILLSRLQEAPAVVEEAPDLIEVAFGELEGLTEAEVAARLPAFYGDWKAGKALGYPGGESFAGFSQRVARAFDGLLARHPRGNLLVVVHKGIIKRGMAHLLGLSQEAVAAMEFALGSVTVLLATSAGRFRLEHLGLTAPAP